VIGFGIPNNLRRESHSQLTRYNRRTLVVESTEA
jgi:hypothetical protein